ncbi:Hpt domain-containing protein [Sporomusa sp.]|uniref:Hpt domain-containing protein n=1 Tax=Sporomusa sp. TaxID=2078658 RepID=UPI002BF37636|nr:Hpt domain-containing protein [Sporomusa sp.]HWR45559.1 Hpt domain-containing protein [Sporomusa sp.]
MKDVVVIDRDLEDLIPGFLANRQTDISAIKAAVDVQDYESVRVIGHTLKGIGGGYGFERVTEIGAAVEQAGKRKDAVAAYELAQELKQYLEFVEIRYE